MTTDKKKKAKKSTRTEKKEERLRFLVGLFHAGKSRNDIFKIMCATFKIKSSTVQGYIAELGNKTRDYYDSEPTIELELAASIERLKERSQRDDHIGNRADEVLHNILGVRALKPIRRQIEYDRHRLAEEKIRFAEYQAEQARLQLEKAKRVEARDIAWGTAFTERLANIREKGSANIKDVLGLTVLFLEREVSKGQDSDIRQIMSSLRHLTKISLADPAGTGMESQIFLLPEGMMLPEDEPDFGDDLVT